MHKVFDMPVSEVYPHYINKVKRKGQNPELVDVAITWLTGFDAKTIANHLESKTSFRDFFGGAKINPNAPLITGTICGVKIQEIQDPLMKQIRYLDKLVDELAQGRSLEKVLRTPKD
jgi:hypothetical protein